MPSSQAISIRAALAAQTLGAGAPPAASSASGSFGSDTVLVLSADSDFVAERIYTIGDGLTGTDAGAGGTFTVAVDGTVARTTWAVNAGNGLTGGGNLAAAGITVTLGAPSSATVSSTNSVSSTSHTHAVTTSSNPGAAATILASDGTGSLTLVNQTLTGNLNFGADVTLNRKGAHILELASGDSFESLTYTSGLAGWHIDTAGNAEFQNILARGEFQASVFKVSEITATAGTFGVFKSAAAVASDYTAPGAIGSSNTLVAKNSSVGAALLATNDILRIKSYDGTAIRDLWFTVTAVGANSGPSTSYTVRLEAGTVGVTFKAGTAIADYGPNGAGFITLSADGTLGASANITIADHDATWVGSNPNKAFTTNLRVRLGNLNGSFGLSSDLYGIGIGDYSGGNYLEYDSTNGFTLKGGGGAVKIDGTGLNLSIGTSIGFYSDTTYTHAQGGILSGSGASNAGIILVGEGYTGKANGIIEIEAIALTPTTSTVLALNATDSGATGYGALSGTGFLGFTIGANASPNAMLDVRGSGIVTGGLNVGSATSAATGDIRLSGTVWPGPAAGTGSTGVASQRFVLGAGATAQLFGGGSFGTLFLHDQSAGVTGIYMLRGGAHVTNEISDLFTNFDTSSASAMIDIYWSGTAYTIKNGFGVSHTVDCVLLGSP